MRIVQALGWYYPENLGGTEVYVEGLSHRLRAAGHEVLVAAPDPGGAAEREYEHDGSVVYRFPTPAQPTLEECQCRAPVRGSERYYAWLAARRPDIVHMHTFVTGMSLHEAQAARSGGARVVVTTHSSSLGFLCARGTMMRWGESLCDGRLEPGKCAACRYQQLGLPKPAARLLSALPLPLSKLAQGRSGRVMTALAMKAIIQHNLDLQNETLTAVDKFVTLTQWGFDALLANGAPPAKLALNRLGMSQTDIVRKPGPDQSPTTSPPLIGYLGRFDPIKGVLDLARAWASLPKDLSVRLEMRGPLNGAQSEATLAEIRRIIGDDPRVAIEPAVPAARSPEILADYDLLCCPPVCLEGGPTVAIEAHGVGTPVFGTRIGGLAEIVTDGVDGLLVPPGDWRALAVAIVRVANDPAGTIDAWRMRLPPARTMDQIAREYLEMYAA